MTFPPVPANATLRSLQLENCTGYQAFFDAPRTSVEGATPDDFRNVEGTLPATASLWAKLQSCKRLVAPGFIIENYDQLLLAPLTHTKNESWEPVRGPSYYFFDFLVSSEEVARLYRSWGLPAAKAEFTSEPFVDGRSRTWTIARNDTIVKINHPIRTNPNRAPDIDQNATNYRWAGVNPYLRATVGVVFTYYNDLQYGSIEFEGPSKTASVLGTGRQAVEGREYVRLDEILTVDATLFYGGERA